MNNITLHLISKMSAAECRAALRMGYNTRDNVKPEFLADLDARLAAIEERLRQLNRRQPRPQAATALIGCRTICRNFITGTGRD